MSATAIFYVKVVNTFLKANIVSNDVSKVGESKSHFDFWVSVVSIFNNRVALAILVLAVYIQQNQFV